MRKRSSDEYYVNSINNSYVRRNIIRMDKSRTYDTYGIICGVFYSHLLFYSHTCFHQYTNTYVHYR